MLVGIRSDTKSVQDMLKNVVDPSDSAKVALDNSGTNDSKTADIKTVEKKPSDTQKTDAKPPVVKSNQQSSGSSKGGTTKKSTPTKKSSRGFSYPNQNLSEYGMLSVKTNVSARVFIDKIEYGDSNGPPIKLAGGRHFIEIEADGFRRLTRRIFTEKGEKAEVEVDLIAE